MKKKIIITIIILLTTVALGVGGYFIFSLNQPTIEFEDTDAEYETTLLEAPNDGTSPKDHTLEENVAYALWKITKTNEFYTLTTGTAQASIATQQIYNKRVVKDGKAMTTMISSGIVSTAKQKYYLPDKVLLRDATSINGDQATWVNTAPECVSYKTIRKRYGWLPTAATGYIICEDTYINKENMEIIDNNDGTYKLCFDLDPSQDKAPFWYMREVATNAGSAIYPEFHFIHFEMTINSSWQIICNDIQEQYKVKSRGVEAVTKTNCHEAFYYENVEFEKDPYDYFESYAYLSVLDDDKEDVVQNDCMSIIVESLQNSDGSDSIFDLSITTNTGARLDGVVSLNIIDLENIKVLAKLEDLYVEYTDSIYISMGGIKVKANPDSLTEVISKFEGLLPSDTNESSLDVNKIMEDLANSSMEEDGENVSIDTTLHFMGIDLPIHFNIKHDGDSYLLKNASAKLDAFNETFNLKLESSKKQIEKMEHKDFMDLVNLEFIVDDVIDIIEKKSVDLSIDLSFQGLNINVLGNLSFNAGISLDSTLTIMHKDQSLSLDLYYQKDTLYVSYDDINLKITKEDLLRLIEKYSSISLNLSDSIDVSTLLKSIIFIDFDKLFQELIITEDSLSLKLGLSELNDKINEIQLLIKDELYGLSGDIKLDDIKASFKVGKLNYKQRKINDSTYYNLAYLEGILDSALALYKARKLGFDIDATYESIKILGYGVIDFKKEIALYTSLIIEEGNNSLDLKITYLNDVLYLELGNTNLKISKEDLLKIVSRFIDLNMDSFDMSLDNILDTLFNIDFEKLIEEVIIEEDLLDITLDLSDFVSSLNKIKASIKKSDNLNLDISLDSFDLNIDIYEANENIQITKEYINLGYIDGFMEDILAIYNSKKIAFDMDITYDTLKAKANGVFDFEDSIKASFDVTISYHDKDFVISVTYLEDVLYLSYQDIHFKVNVIDLLSLAKEYTDLDLSKNNIDVSNIISILLSLDTDKLLKNLELTENVIDVELDLSVFLESLGLLKTTITKGEELSIVATLDKALIDLKISSTIEEVIYKDYSYYDLMELEDTFKNILKLYQNKKMGFNLNTTYKGVIVNASGILDFSDSISLQINLALHYKDKNYDIDIVYLDDVLYLSLFNTNLKITKEDLVKIMDKFSGDSNNESILDKILSIDFNALIDEITIESNILSLKADLSVIKDNLDTLVLALGSNFDEVTLDITYLDFIIGLNLFETNDSVIFNDSSSYYDLGYLGGIFDDVLAIIQSKKLELELSLSYKDLDIFANGLLDFNDGIKMTLNASISYASKEIHMDLAYFDDSIYLDFENVHLMVSKLDLEEIIKMFASDDKKDILEELLNLDFNAIIQNIDVLENTLSLSLDLSELVSALKEIDIIIKDISSRLDVNVSIKDLFDISISASTQALDLSIKNNEYQDLGNLKGLLEVVASLIKEKKMALDIDLKYEEVSILGDVSIFFKDEVSIYSNLSIEYKFLKENIEIYYFDSYLDYSKVILIDFKNNHLLLPLDVFMDSMDSVSLEDILDVIFSVDFKKMIVSFILSEDNIELSLSLSDFELLNRFIQLDDDIKMNLSLKENKIVLESNDVIDLTISISHNDNDVKEITHSYIDLSDTVKDILGFVSWVNKDSFRISLDGTIDIKDILINIHGYLDFILNDDAYDMNGSIHVEAMNTIHDIKIKLKNNVLYLEYGEITFGIDLSNPKEFIEEVMKTLELDHMEFDFSKLDSILDTLVIDEDKLSIDLSSLADIIGNIVIAMDSINDGDSYSLDILGDEIHLDVSISKIDSYSVIVKEDYLDNLSIISLCKSVRNILNILDEKNFNVQFDFDIIKDTKKYLNIYGSLNFFLDISDNEKFKLDDLSFDISLAITEYNSDKSIKVIHRVNVVLIDDMVYLIYGNNENKPSSKLKFYLEKDSLLSVLASLTNVFGLKLEFLEPYMKEDIQNVDFSQLTDLFTKDSKTFDISNDVKSLVVKEDGITLTLLASILNDVIPEDKLVTVDLTTGEDILLNLSLDGLFTDYVNETEYTLINVNQFMVSKGNEEIHAPSSLSGFRDISDIDELVNGLLTTGSNKDYAIEGSVILDVPVVGEVNVKVDAKVRVLEDGSPLVYIHLDMTDIPLLAKTIGLKEKNVYFYYMDGYVYIYRVESSLTYKLKVSYQEFFNDIMYYLMDFSLGMPSIILNAINSSTKENEDYVIDAGTVLNNYQYSNHKFKIALNMESLTGNSNLGEMAFSLVLKKIAVSKNEDSSINTSYALMEIADFNFVIANVVNLSSSSISLVNTEEKNGYTWFTNIDMSDVLSWISSYTYGTDMIYKNDIYDGKRSHEITFVLNYLDNEYFVGQTGSTIVFPNLDVISYDGKYYLFSGWYKDKYLKNPFTDTTVGESNMKLYASWREVSYYDLVVYSMDGNNTYSLYDGEELDFYLNKGVYTDSSLKSYILKGYSDTLDGEIKEYKFMPKDNLTLYAIWEEVSYKVYIDGNYYMDLTLDTNLALMKDYYLSIDELYFAFDSSLLNYDTLVGKYSDSILVVDGIGCINLFSDISNLDGYYTVFLDYNYNKFNDKLYKSVSLPNTMDFDSKYLPASTYNHMSINYWYNDDVEYHYGNIHTIAHKDITLYAYYATKDYLSYGYDSSSGESLLSVTGYSYQDSTPITLVLPKYVYVNGGYDILRSLAIFVDEESNKYSVFSGKKNILAIYFSDGFTTIGANAFKNSTALTNVYFSTTLVSVAQDAFYMNNSSSFDTNASYCEKIRFYLPKNSLLSTSDWLACKSTFSSKYYGQKSSGVLGIGKVDLSNAFQNYDGLIRDIVHEMF